MKSSTIHVAVCAMAVTLALGCHAALVPGVVITVSPQGGALGAGGTFTLNPHSITVKLDATTPPGATGAGFGAFTGPDVVFQPEPLNADGTFGAFGALTNPLVGTAIPVAATPGIVAPVYVDTNSNAVVFAAPGLYRIAALFHGTGNPTGSIFIYVGGAAQVQDTLLINKSAFHINHEGKTKVDPKKPWKQPLALLTDILQVSGFMNLADPARSTQDLTLFDLQGKQAVVTLNGTQIFNGVLDEHGSAKQAPQGLIRGVTGTFQLSLPSGEFFCQVRANLEKAVGFTAHVNEQRLATALYQIQISGTAANPGDIFNSPPTVISYDYFANYAAAVAAHAPAPAVPEKDSAKGTFSFGAFANFPNDSNIPPGFGRAGGQTLAVSGSFFVTGAKLKLQGSSVSADITGKLARYGGDDLRPDLNSFVDVTIGGWATQNFNVADRLNFSTTPGFGFSGKRPQEFFTFVRKGALPASGGVTLLKWANRVGDFHIVAQGLPNALVGLNGAGAHQTLKVGLTIGTTFDAFTNLGITKSSATNFVHLK